MKRWLFRLFIVALIASAIGAIVALNDQKRRLAEMSDEELRAFLGRKLEGRVPPDKVDQIRDKVTAAVRAGSASPSAPMSGNGGVATATETVTETVKEVVEESVDVAADAAEGEEAPAD